MSRRAHADELLELEVAGVNSNAGFTGGRYVTLFVGGAVVCGELIPVWKWLEEMHASVTADLPDDTDSHYREMARSVRAVTTAVEKVRESAPDLADDLESAFGQTTRYIHLRDARVFLPGSPPMPGNGLLWRGTLSSIDGWSHGQLTAG